MCNFTGGQCDAALADVLMFFTGARVFPPCGFDDDGELSFNRTNPYPTASTCSFSLTLPTKFEDYFDFKHALDVAFTCHGGFGLVWSSIYCCNHSWTALCDAICISFGTSEHWHDRGLLTSSDPCLWVPSWCTSLCKRTILASYMMSLWESSITRPCVLADYSDEYWQTEKHIKAHG